MNKLGEAVEVEFSSWGPGEPGTQWRVKRLGFVCRSSPWIFALYDPYVHVWDECGLNGEQVATMVTFLGYNKYKNLTKEEALTHSCRFVREFLAPTIQ